MIKNLNILMPENTIGLNGLLNLFDLEGKCHTQYFPQVNANVTNNSDPAIQVLSDSVIKEKYSVGNLKVSINNEIPIQEDIDYKKPKLKKLSDKYGDYLKVDWGFGVYHQLTFEELVRRLKSHIIGIEHIGIEINENLLQKEKYLKLKKTLASESFMYDFPFNKEWPFIIPVTKDEFSKDKITNEDRFPKFELVYDFKYNYPEIHIDLQTDLPAKEILKLFPSPYGYYDDNPIEGDYCVSVFIYTGWRSVSLRVDIRFYIPEFNLTEFLIKKGARVK